MRQQSQHAGWRMFRQMLEYKCEWYGKKLIVVAPQYTSRIWDWLAVRQWECPFCHAQHDRDVNASRNILKRALA